MKQMRQHARGVTLLELLVVVTIIGILALVSLPNIVPIIAGHRIRSTGNDLLSKMRSLRSVSIAKLRQLDVTIDVENYVLKVEKPAHTEYDLLKDIAEAISTSSSAFPNLSSFVLFTEGSQVLEEIRIGNSVNAHGIDKMETTCPNGRIRFEPSGTLRDTCAITVFNNRSKSKYEVRLYKGGQIVLERLMF